MKRYACILLPPPNSQLRLHLPLFGSYREALQKFLRRSRPFEALYFAFLGGQEEGQTESLLLPAFEAEEQRIVQLAIPGSDWNSLLLHLYQDLASAEYEDSVHFFWGDSALLNSELELDVEKLFIEHHADYAFADGFPLGLAPELLRANRLLSTVQISHLNPLPITRGGLFELIQKDINSFHIETKVSELDIRLQRLQLNSESLGNHRLLSRYCEELLKRGLGEAPAPSELETLFDEKLISQRALPAVLHLQISDSCGQTCSYCPFPLLKPDLLTAKGIMPRADVLQIARDFVEWTGGGTISLSPIGEPARHPEIAEIIEDLLDIPELALTLESSGIGWHTQSLEKLGKIRRAYPGKVKLIIGADAWDEESYAEVHSGSFKEFMAFCDGAFAADPEHTWVQMVREKGREASLLKFMRFWESRTKNIIVQKFDSWAGYLENKVVVDLRPLKRLSCWHIKREFVVLIDGSVPLCRQEIPQKPIGKLGEASMAQIWEEIGQVYDRHRESDLPERCAVCDEFYTYTY